MNDRWEDEYDMSQRLTKYGKEITMTKKKKENTCDGDNFLAIDIESCEVLTDPTTLRDATKTAIERKNFIDDARVVVAQIILEAETTINVKPYGEV